jgi:hypothetical protein
MQISSLIDRFGNLGKPLHITAAAAPSSAGATQSGEWRGPWSEAVQAEWARELYRIAFSKPFVETVTWASPADSAPDSPGCGLFKADGSPKPVFDELMFLRGSVLGVRAREPAPAE